MVVELLDLHSQWMNIDEARSPLHLIFIEEPEVHLHAQLQQVFIREVLNILPIEGEDASHYHSQLVVTTHSSHILYERGFQLIRYFRRQSVGDGQSSEVLNLSSFYNKTENLTRGFLERYLEIRLISTKEKIRYSAGHGDCSMFVAPERFRISQ